MPNMIDFFSDNDCDCVNNLKNGRKHECVGRVGNGILWKSMIQMRKVDSRIVIYIFHRRTASKTSWREYFYSHPIKSQNKQSSSPLTKHLVDLKLQ